MFSRRPLPTALRSLAHPGYRRWAAANTFSVLGTWMQVASQSWLVLQLSGSGAVLGTGIALTALPSLLLGPWGGVVADRFPRRTVLVATQGLFAALALTQALAAWRGWLTVPMLLACSLASGLIAVVDSPAGGALGATLVPPEDLANAAALGSAANSVGRVAGMSAAGVAIAVGGPGLGYGLNAASYLPVIGVLGSLPAGVPVLTEASARPVSAMREGLGFVLRSRPLLWLVGLMFVLGALGRSYQVTMAMMVERVLGGEAGAYAVSSTAFAAGALVGAVAAAHIRRVTGTVVLLAGTASAVAELAAGAAPTLAVFVLVIVGAGAAAVVVDTTASTRFAVAAPDAVRGRVLAVAGAAGAGAGALGGPALGAMAELAGARVSLLAGGLACLLACAVMRRGITAGEPVPTPAAADLGRSELAAAA